MTTYKKLQPEIRFAGFTDDWEQRKLGDIVEIVGGGTPDTTNSDYWNGDIDWYSPSEIGDQIYATQSLKKITSLGLSKSSAKILPKDKTILFTSRASIGDMAILKNQATTNQGFQSFVVIDDIHVYFLYSMGNKIKEFALKNASGSTFLEISKNQLSRMDISLPSLEEQTAIGNFFKQLDDTITLHQRTLEKYQKLKISYLEKMFPKENEQYPELRFPNFTDAWEQRKLGVVATFLNGRAYKQNELLKYGKYPVLRVGNFYTNNHWYYSNLELNEKFYAHNGDLLYTWATVFSPHIWRGDKVIYHYHIWKIELSEELNKLFAYYLLEADEQSLTSNTNGSTMVHVTKSEIENKVIMIPSLEEQTAIGNFFKQLDDTIALHQREVEKYKKIKQSYLEKMFI